MKQLICYLDNAATTRPCEEAVEAAVRLMREGFGNPSSLHRLGVQAARELTRAREAVAALLGCDSESVCFTSGGSEANHLALLCGARARARAGRRIVSTAVEHASVRGALRQLEQEGFEVVYVPPNPDGTLDHDALLAAVDEKTALVSVMHVNNETGAVFAVEEIAARLRARFPRLLIHCDGVQAFGKLPLRLARTAIDLYSVSGHKICAPKGAGALYIRRGLHLPPLVAGGGQERGMRAGTEGMPMIAAMGAACEKLGGRQAENLARARQWMDGLMQELSSMPQVCVNSPTGHLPYIISLSVPGWRGETLLHALEERDVFVSSGSACSKGAASPVLKAMGLERALVDGALRISICYDTAQEECSRLVEALRAAIATVAHR